MRLKITCVDLLVYPPPQGTYETECLTNQDSSAAHAKNTWPCLHSPNGVTKMLSNKSYPAKQIKPRGTVPLGPSVQKTF